MFTSNTNHGGKNAVPVKYGSSALVLLVIILFSAAYFPAFTILAEKWRNSLDYTYAFFTVPVIMYMVWAKRAELCKLNGGTVLGFCAVTFSTLLYIFALQIQVPTAITLSMVCTILSCFLFLFGLAAIRFLLIPTLLLLLLIPIPNQVYGTITLPLQLKVTDISHLLLQLADIPIFTEGNILHTPKKSFEVVEACSGLRSLIALMSLSLMLGYFTLCRATSILVLTIASLPVAIVVNIMRVVTMVCLYHFFDIDLTEGTYHLISGAILFSIALVLLYYIQCIIEKWEPARLSN